MNQIPVEWSQAQTVLLKLVQALTPWTNRRVSASFFLSKRFSYSKNGEELAQIRSPVKLLGTLRTTREFVEAWVEEGASQSTPHETKDRRSVPFAKQAERMIDEVQEAIGVMVLSLKDPKEELLKSTLKKLRPHLDHLIEAVVQEGMHSADDRPTPFRFSVPTSAREHLLKKLPQRGEKIGWEIQEKKEGGELAQPEARSSSQSSEKKILPGAPFLSQSKSLTPPEKKKKKRRGFWFRDEDSEQERS